MSYEFIAVCRRILDILNIITIRCLNLAPRPGLYKLQLVHIVKSFTKLLLLYLNGLRAIYPNSRTHFQVLIRRSSSLLLTSSCHRKSSCYKHTNLFTYD